MIEFFLEAPVVFKVAIIVVTFAAGVAVVALIRSFGAIRDDEADRQVARWVKAICLSLAGKPQGIWLKVKKSDERWRVWKYNQGYVIQKLPPTNERDPVVLVGNMYIAPGVQPVWAYCCAEPGVIPLPFNAAGAFDYPESFRSGLAAGSALRRMARQLQQANPE